MALRSGIPSFILAAVLAAALSACANQPLPGVNPTPARTSPPPGATTAPVVVEEETVVVVDEDGVERVVAVEEGVEVVPAVSNAQREADIQDCHAYASAQVTRDERMQDDRAALFSQNNLDPTYALVTQMDNFGNEQRRGRLFDNCMEAKGYGEQ